MKPHRYDSNGSHKIGTEAEKYFSHIMEELGYKVRKANKQEDMVDHIDFFCKKKSNPVKTFDVKGDKRESRNKENGKVTSDKAIWVEFQNERPYKNGNFGGWMYGKSQMIAFFIKEYDYFVSVPRKKLVSLCESLIDINKIVSNSTNAKKIRCCYRRTTFGKKYELTAIITLKELLSLDHFIISKNGVEKKSGTKSKPEDLTSLFSY